MIAAGGEISGHPSAADSSAPQGGAHRPPNPMSPTPSNHNLPPISDSLRDRLRNDSLFPAIGRSTVPTWSAWAGRMLRWRSLGGIWYLQDCDVAHVLNEPIRVLNQRATRNLDSFPADFGYRLSRWEAEVAFLSRDFRRRRGGREPWVYSLAGILQLRRLSGRVEADLLRYVCALVTRMPAPMPPAICLPMPPRTADDMAGWAQLWTPTS